MTFENDYQRGGADQANIAPSDQFEMLRGMGIDGLASARLRTIDDELASMGRHLLNSNDRYQVASAHLMFARNHFMVFSSIAEDIGRSQAEAVTGRNYDRNAIHQFVFAGFERSKQALVLADHTYADKGYRATDDDLASLSGTYTTTSWPTANYVSRGFLQGGFEAAGMLYGFMQYTAEQTFNSPLLDSRYKTHLEKRVRPLILEADSRFVSLDKAVGGLQGFNVTSETSMQVVLSDIVKTLQLLDEVTIMLSVPQARSHALRPTQPITEVRPGYAAFAPSLLPTVVEKPVRPDHPFAPAPPPVIPDTPTPPLSSDRRARATKPFNPMPVAPPAATDKSSERRGRPFAPSPLPRVKKPFAPAPVEDQGQADEDSGEDPK